MSDWMITGNVFHGCRCNVQTELFVEKKDEVANQHSAGAGIELTWRTGKYDQHIEKAYYFINERECEVLACHLNPTAVQKGHDLVIAARELLNVARKHELPPELSIAVMKLINPVLEYEKVIK